METVSWMKTVMAYAIKLKFLDAQIQQLAILTRPPQKTMDHASLRLASVA